MKIDTFFAKHPVFRYEEFANFMKERGIAHPASVRQQLSYYHKAGRLLHLRRMLYAVKPAGLETEDHWVDPYLIAAKASKESVLAYHTALELHNLAYTIFEELTYLCNHTKKSFQFQNQTYRSVIVPKSLVMNKVSDTGILTIQHQGLEIKITNLERTIVDVLDRPDLAGGWEEVLRSLEHVIQINTDQLIKYTLLLNNAATVAKVGYYLELRPSHLKTNQQFTKKLLDHIPKQPYYMDRNNRGKGTYIKKWQLIVPNKTIEQQWEEPNDSDV
ncbi:MAG: hypothetical protein A3F10_05780 [Coxiella sp. RIFCSPHIGHO2_12_FULL_42_15]|nr:MAG: hypothetical protein A3F10_05780 [Coxiella sp. RIFCSPHIGHO2_12_FULL_42_15]